MISHPLPISVGLTLFSPTGEYNFPSIYWHQSSFDTFAVRQASRRAWRIGQTQPCRVYFSFYERTIQERAIKLVAQKVQASLALEGHFSSDGLAAMTDEGGSIAMELAKQLVEDLPFGEHERIWSRVVEGQVLTRTPLLV